MNRKIAGAAATAAAVAALAAGCKTTSTTAAPPVTHTSAPAATSAPATSAPATSAPAAPATPASPSMTAAQAQAVQAAQGYLDLGTGFSYQGLLKQLTSSYGSGFSASDATFAIRYLHPDWDQQAVEAAKGYLALGTGFSRASLITQLTSAYGSGFTYAQAVYAAGKAGL